ncbi:MAG: NAD-dependent DNA ligase LigA [Treponema sp.]|jgi:DNA ligase (NAD+)|nr:NAD-dependent DNA ligase LigA [Treponema sp.]
MTDNRTADGMRSEKETNGRIAELTTLIEKYQNSYYNGEGEISDAAFDKLWDELKLLDPDNVLFRRIGSDSGNFSKIRHIMPMGSQEKAADPEQFLDWVKKHTYAEYLVEYKLDGASLELQYRHGRLYRAVTRGDGIIGDDITANAKKMQGVRLQLTQTGRPVDFTGGVRGEVIMTHKIHDSFFSDKANCRNAANGLMKRKDGTGSENLTLITYDALAAAGPQPFSDEEEKIHWLAACGFITVPLKICRTAEDVIAYRAQVMELRTDLDYDIDGLVVKERAINMEDARRARPDRQIAFKFSLEEAVSVIRSIEWSESGATYTPVAVFDPVELAGTTVKRASLANPDTIRSLGVGIGSRVVVVKRGEIIPKIESVVPDGGSAVIPPACPSVCTSCGTSLVDEGTRLYCPNRDCPKRILHQLFKWISVTDIRDLGDTLVRNLFKSGKLRSIADIYRLDLETLRPFFLNEQSLASEKESLGAQKVLRSIQAHRKISLPVFIAGFDIEGIGETTAEKLVAAGYDTLEKMLAAHEEEFAAVYGFAEIMARTAVKGLHENAAEMKALLESGIIELEEHPSDGALTGKLFCFTGELVSVKRTAAEKMVKDAGGGVKSTVTKDLSYLVTNDTASGSSKNRKAAELGIPVISEEQFLQLFRQTP